jgi:hypothetical protein
LQKLDIAIADDKEKLHQRMAAWRNRVADEPSRLDQELGSTGRIDGSPLFPMPASPTLPCPEDGLVTGHEGASARFVHHMLMEETASMKMLAGLARSAIPSEASMADQLVIGLADGALSMRRMPHASANPRLVMRSGD